MARYQDFSSTAEAFPRWFARQGLREGGHPHKLRLAQVDVALLWAAESQSSHTDLAGSTVPVGTCDWLRLRAGPRARLLVKRGLVGAAVSQREQTSPLYLAHCGRKILKNFQQIEPVAVLTASFRDWKHRRRQSYLQKTPLPPSIS